jgi:hypothetical protein
VVLPRAGTAATGSVAGLTNVAVPFTVSQQWVADPRCASTNPGSTPCGSQYGFSYEVRSNGQRIGGAGRATSQGRWGGRTTGIVSIDGYLYVIPEFWQRQPRQITVTATSVILQFFAGTETMKSGEDAWDRFAILNWPDASLASCAVSDAPTALFEQCAVIDEVERLPQLTATQRTALLEEYGIAPPSVLPANHVADTAVQRYDRWNRASWFGVGPGSLGRYFVGEDDPATTADESAATTLFTLFRKGLYYPVDWAGAFTWREWGNIQWAAEWSSGHYDWQRAAFKDWLRYDDRNALIWAMAATRQQAAVNHIWATPSTFTGSQYDIAGLTRYEKGDHGGADFEARPSHTWVEGQYLAADITADPWVLEAANDTAAAFYRWWGGATRADWGTACYGETRTLGWPMFGLIVGYRQSGRTEYRTKAIELFDEILRVDRAQGSLGTIGNDWNVPSCNNIGVANAASALQNSYTSLGLVATADELVRMGQLTPEREALLVRWATVMTTPTDQGGYVVRPSTQYPFDRHLDRICMRNRACTPTDAASASTQALRMVDLLSWLADRQPNGTNPVTGVRWSDLAARYFREGVTYSANPGSPDSIGFLVNTYPTTETKALGWMQLFGDRAARWSRRQP